MCLPKKVRYSPDEIKALALHYGSYDKAAKKLKIGKASLVDAGNADIKGKAYRLSEANYRKISRHVSRLSTANKKQIKRWEKILEWNSDHFPAKAAFMNAKQSDRLQALKDFEKWKRKISNEKLVEKIFGKLYDKYAWKKGRFSK